MWDGVSLFANWNIRTSGLDEPSSKSIGGIHLRKPVMIASMSWKTSRLTCVSGSAPSVASGTIGISTQQTTFWPRGSRLRPVEGVEVLLGQKLGQATPNEAGMPVREDGKPPPDH